MDETRVIPHEEVKDSEITEAELALNEFFRPRSLFTMSANLAENKLVEDSQENYSIYRTASGEEHSSPDYPPGDKQDFADPNNPNLGWKIHLNIDSTNTAEVIRYLRKNRYEYKFFSGGAISDGKVFTLYVGSFKKVKELSQFISNDLKDKLCRPRAIGDIEFAPGVVARFTPAEYDGELRKKKADIFSKNFYFSGMHTLRADDDELWDIIGKYNYNFKDPGLVAEMEAKRPAMELRAYMKLREMYGDYFYPVKK
jgi:hypothetical protein